MTENHKDAINFAQQNHEELIKQYEIIQKENQNLEENIEISVKKVKEQEEQEQLAKERKKKDSKLRKLQNVNKLKLVIKNF